MIDSGDNRSRDEHTIDRLRAEVEALQAERDAERALADQLAEALQRLYDGFSDKAITAIAAWEAARHE